MKKLEGGLVICLSGGMDSATLIAKAMNDYPGIRIHGLSFDYSQRHWKELEAAGDIANHYKIPHTILGLQSLGEVFAGSALTSVDIDVPEGHYEDETMKATVVPNRNMIMLALATGFAISHGMNMVGYAAHSGDHAIYPDCRQGFVHAMRSALSLAYFEKVFLYTPFLNRSKAQIAEFGLRMGTPYHLTWSCYKGELLHCGLCGTCVERLEAFQQAGSVDPVEYGKDGK